MTIFIYTNNGKQMGAISNMTYQIPIGATMVLNNITYKVIDYIYIDKQLNTTCYMIIKQVSENEYNIFNTLKDKGVI